MKRLIGSEPVLAPSDFVAVFNQSLDMMYPIVTIFGEMAHFKISKNRWVYFDLIDETASVKFFGTVNSLPGPLEDGLKMEVSGVPRLHPKFGFSIHIASIRVTGDGSIAKANMLLEKKLLSEGLFDETRKRSLPYPPEKIGLITSVESAAYSDFMKIVNHRWPALDILVEDVLVQGADAPSQIISAIDKLNQTSMPPETLVIIRGGGSADDLAAFSTEQVVRAVAGSRIPTIVGVGHESDVSLSELAADRRASTPSNAAELLVPSIDNEIEKISSVKKSLNLKLASIHTSMHKETEFKRERIDQILSNIFVQLTDNLKRNKLVLKNLNPVAPLSRGFALITDEDGKTLRSARQANLHHKMNIRFVDGKIRVIKEE